jgi:c-di-GMP-binding flagellar brake protein YcgR
MYRKQGEKMPEGQIYLDRRKHLRVDKKLNVSFRLMPKEESERDAINAAKKHVESVDISTSGMQLICEEHIDVDRVIRMDVVVDGEDAPIATFAEVRWCRHDDKLRKYRVGIEFLVIKEDHISAIKKITGEM